MRKATSLNVANFGDLGTVQIQSILLRRQRRKQFMASPPRPLQPPFPNGKCGGTLVTIPPEDTFGIDPILNSILLPPRPIQVWLPPTYDGSKEQTYPVLYCHDGQNAVEDGSSWTGSSWRLTGALTRLAERNLLHSVPIVVLLPSADGDLLPGLKRRHAEYGDTANAVAQAHADFVVQTVKPLIDAKFRTCPKSESTCAIGTSLGGQASLHLLLRHPQIFGGAACLSPAFQPATIASVVTAGSFLNQNSKDILSNKKLYLDNGGDVEEEKVPFFDVMDHLSNQHWWNPGYWWLDTQLQFGTDAMRAALDQVGAKYVYHREPGARHNERAWAQRIYRPLLHLYGK